MARNPAPTLAPLTTSADLASVSPSKLLDWLHIHLRTHHYSIRTEEAYGDWARQFILFHGRRRPQDMDTTELEDFFTHAMAARITGLKTPLTLVD